MRTYASFFLSAVLLAACNGRQDGEIPETTDLASPADMSAPADESVPADLSDSDTDLSPSVDMATKTVFDWAEVTTWWGSADMGARELCNPPSGIADALDQFCHSQGLRLKSVGPSSGTCMEAGGTYFTYSAIICKM